MDRFWRSLGPTKGGQATYLRKVATYPDATPQDGPKMTPRDPKRPQNDPKRTPKVFLGVSNEPKLVPINTLWGLYGKGAKTCSFACFPHHRGDQNPGLPEPTFSIMNVATAYQKNVATAYQKNVAAAHERCHCLSEKRCHCLSEKRCRCA